VFSFALKPFYSRSLPLKLSVRHAFWGFGVLFAVSSSCTFTPSKFQLTPVLSFYLFTFYPVTLNFCVRRKINVFNQCFSIAPQKKEWSRFYPRRSPSIFIVVPPFLNPP
jgi:hypothetical protein